MCLQILDYIHSNRLRLWLCDQTDNDQKTLKETLIQHRKTYLDQMEYVGIELKRVLKKQGLIVFILGDVHISKNNSLNSAKDISEIFKNIGFEILDIFSDEIPAARMTIAKYGGVNSIKNKREKLDRILIMRNE